MIKGVWKGFTFADREFPFFSMWVKQLVFSLNLFLHLLICGVLLFCGVWFRSVWCFGGFGADLLFGLLPSWVLWRFFLGFPVRWSLFYGLDVFQKEYDEYRERVILRK